MDNLPDKIKRIDILKVAYGKRKLCKCKNFSYEIDYENKLVICIVCGAVVEPLEALLNIAKHYNRLELQVEDLLVQRKEIAKYKPHLITIKHLEQETRAGYIPCCPRCGKNFELKELTRWSIRNL